MYFTREPVIETVITSREGYKLSVRNTKHFSQDPFIVEAIEVVSLGRICFFRNCDQSKPFMVPAGDYEVMEIRDAKINLKAIGLDRGIKIAGGREALIKLTKSSSTAASSNSVNSGTVEEVAVDAGAPSFNAGKKEKKEGRKDKDFHKGSESWKEKKRHSSRKNIKEISEVVDSSQEMLGSVTEEGWEGSSENPANEKKFSLLPPPSKLISEVISQAVEDTTTVSSADLNESLQALVQESDEVISALLSTNDVAHFPEEVALEQPKDTPPVSLSPETDM